MNFSTHEPGRLLPLAGILVPVGAVIAARVLFSTGPAQAPAAEVGPTVMPDLVSVSAPPGTSLSASQREALDYLATMDAGSIRSPMARPAPMPDGPRIELPPAEAPPDDPRDHLELSSVVGSGPRAIASISGRVYRIGDQLLDAWTLTAIDVRSRSVTLTHADGRVCTLEHTGNN